MLVEDNIAEYNSPALISNKKMCFHLSAIFQKSMDWSFTDLPGAVILLWLNNLLFLGFDSFFFLFFFSKDQIVGFC